MTYKDKSTDLLLVEKVYSVKPVWKRPDMVDVDFLRVDRNLIYRVIRRFYLEEWEEIVNGDKCYQRWQEHDI